MGLGVGGSIVPKQTSLRCGTASAIDSVGGRGQSEAGRGTDAARGTGSPATRSAVTRSAVTRSARCHLSEPSACGVPAW